MSSNPPTHKPSLMKVDAALAYLRNRYGMTVTRRTLYNWVKLGVRGVKLQHSGVPNPLGPTCKDPVVLALTAQQIETFLASVGVGMKGVNMR